MADGEKRQKAQVTIAGSDVVVRSEVVHERRRVAQATLLLLLLLLALLQGEHAQPLLVLRVRVGRLQVRLVDADVGVRLGIGLVLRVRRRLGRARLVAAVLHVDVGLITYRNRSKSLSEACDAHQEPILNENVTIFLRLG